MLAASNANENAVIELVDTTGRAVFYRWIRHHVLTLGQSRTLAEVDLVCGIHMKRSARRVILDALGKTEEEAIYLEDTGHMCGVDLLLALDRASRLGRVTDGDLVLLIAAGTGYTWAAACVRWGTAG